MEVCTLVWNDSEAAVPRQHLIEQRRSPLIAELARSHQQIVLQVRHARAALAFVHYLQTGEMQICKESARELRRLADQYQALALRQACERVLAERWSWLRGTWHYGLRHIFHTGAKMLARAGARGLQRRGYRRRYLSLDENCTLHVFEALGDNPRGPLIVLLHGLGASAVDYRAFLGRVRRSCRRVVALDYPGHGFSGVPDSKLSPELFTALIRDALDYLIGDEQAVLVGNSLGGMVAVKYHAYRPSAVEALVLASPGGAPMDHPALSTLLNTFRLGSHAEALTFVQRLFVRPPRFMRHFLAGGVRALFGQTHLQDFISTVHPDDLVQPEELEAIRKPVLLMWGASDHVLERHSHLSVFQEHLKGANVYVEEPDGIGHFPVADDPRGFTERVLRFIEEAVPGRSFAGDADLVEEKVLNRALNHAP